MSFLALLLLAEFGLALEQGPFCVSSSVDCGKACSGRCRLASRPHLCKRACGTCCARLCPCYYNMKTHGNKHKCP
ncbi:hypothetical protein AMTRI_Chr09g40380 [Amborella trichopoda]